MRVPQLAVHSHGVFQELRETQEQHHRQQVAQQVVVQQQYQQAQQQQQQVHQQQLLQRERREADARKRKEINCSANASTEVKQILQVRNKEDEEAFNVSLDLSS